MNFITKCFHFTEPLRGVHQSVDPLLPVHISVTNKNLPLLALRPLLLAHLTWLLLLTPTLSASFCHPAPVATLPTLRRPQLYSATHPPMHQARSSSLAALSKLLIIRVELALVPTFNTLVWSIHRSTDFLLLMKVVSENLIQFGCIYIYDVLILNISSVQQVNMITMAQVYWLFVSILKGNAVSDSDHR